MGRARETYVAHNLWWTVAMTLAIQSDEGIRRAALYNMYRHSDAKI